MKCSSLPQPSDYFDYRTKEILTFAIVAFESFSTDTMVWCVAEHDAFCRFQTMFDRVDQTYNVDQWVTDDSNFDSTFEPSKSF